MGWPRLTPDSPCTKCGRSHPEVSFYIRETGRRRGQCKTCMLKANKVSKKIYNSTHIEERREAARRYFQESVDKEKRKITYKKWAEQNLLKKSSSNHSRRAKLYTAEGSWTPREWEQIKMFYNYRCLRCHRKEPEINVTLDHVIPLSKGGSNSRDNLQPLCGPCNSVKKDKDTDYRLTKPMWTFPEEERGYDFEEEDEDG